MNVTCITDFPDEGDIHGWLARLAALARPWPPSSSRSPPASVKLVRETARA